MALELGPELRVLTHARHGNKLRVGHLRGNRFRIRIRDAERPDAAGPVMERLVAEGLPNAFGEQRFGRGDTALRGRALVLGERLPSKPSSFERKLYVSAYQALLFNRMLEARLGAGTLRRALAGDLMRKTDSGGLFVCRNRRSIRRGSSGGRSPRPGRCSAGRCSGRKGRSTRPSRRSSPPRGSRSRASAARAASPRGRVARSRFRSPRRSWSVDGSTVELPFTLPTGSYATVLLDEVMKARPRTPRLTQQ